MDQREAGRLLCDILSGRIIPEAGRTVLSSADGESLVDWALRFKVGGLLHRKLKSIGGIPTGLIPPGAGNKLREAYRNTATANTSLFGEAAKVLKSLADHRLPVMALKGLSLAKMIYGDTALRPMSDIDLLLNEKDLVGAGRILLALGYRQYFPDWERLTKIYHHLPPFKKDNGTMIELHWNIVPPDTPIKIDLAGLWERSRLIEIDHLAVRIFSPEDLFLHVCIHAGLQLQYGLDLIPFCDLTGLIKSSEDPIDWPVVLERAARWGGRKCVYLMLLLVRELMGAAPPDPILSEFKPEDYQAVFFDEALEQLLDISQEVFSTALYGPEVSPPARPIAATIGRLSRIHNVRGFQGRIRALFRKAFPPRETLASKYPVSISSPKIYLCYLDRLGHLMVFTLRVLLRICRRDPSVIQEVRQARRASEVSEWMFSPGPVRRQAP